MHDEEVVNILSKGKHMDQQLHSQRQETHKVSKKRRHKMQKIQNDTTLSAEEKQSLMEQMNEGGLQKRQKRSQVQDFRD